MNTQTILIGLVVLMGVGGGVYLLTRPAPEEARIAPANMSLPDSGSAERTQALGLAREGIAAFNNVFSFATRDRAAGGPGSTEEKRRMLGMSPKGAAGAT